MALLDVIRRQRNIKRFNGMFMLQPESVAEHVHYVSYLALKVGMEHRDKVNLEKLLSKAIMHDAEESVIGDIIYEFKHHDMKVEEYVENKAGEIFKEKYGKYHPKLFELYKRERCIENRIILFCDVMEAWLNMIEDYRMGNNLIWPTLERQYKKTKALFEDKIFIDYIREMDFIYKNLK